MRPDMVYAFSVGVILMLLFFSYLIWSYRKDKAKRLRRQRNGPKYTAADVINSQVDDGDSPV